MIECILFNIDVGVVEVWFNCFEKMNVIDFVMFEVFVIIGECLMNEVDL